MHKDMLLRILLLLACFGLAGCSTRVVYEAPAVEPGSGAVNINLASVDELERLPHVGRKTAEAIVEFREKNGPFRRPEQLMLLRGMSETRFLEMRSLIRTE